VGESATGPATLTALRELEPDLLLLDVQMPGLTGFEVLAALEPDERPVVIFSTAYDEYALGAFEVHALDYLLKPYSDDRLLEALARAGDTFRRRRSGEVDRRLDAVLPRHLDRLAVPLRDGISVIDVDTIDWIEAAGDYAELHVGGGKAHLVRTTLATLESRLDPACFTRIHRSTIVRLAGVHRLRSDTHGDYRIVLANGVELRVGRSYRDSVLERVGLRL
jgi:two-component system LytT family response regulator